MIYPIVAYGSPILKQKSVPIHFQTNIQPLIDSMFETMYHAGGVGLAAPQINQRLCVFVVDAEPMDEVLLKGFKKVFINPEIITTSGPDIVFEEGCLSIPGVRGQVWRPENIIIKYYDQNWQLHQESFSGMAARVIQHEYDHLQGILVPDHWAVLKRKLMEGKLKAISKGITKADYRMLFLKK